MRSSAFLALTLTDSKDSQTFRTDTKARKYFFFEKKKQKTFVYLAPSLG